MVILVAESLWTIVFSAKPFQGVKALCAGIHVSAAVDERERWSDTHSHISGGSILRMVGWLILWIKLKMSLIGRIVNWFGEMVSHFACRFDDSSNHLIFHGNVRVKHVGVLSLVLKTMVLL